jgi:5-formyltetrahydrofolate cyclo-ligase
MRQLARTAFGDSQAVVTALTRWLAAHPTVRTISVFAALPDEPDLADFVVQNPDRCWLYPKIDGDSLHFHAVKNPYRDLQPGAFGIQEPLPCLPEIPVDRIDAFFCPGLAFDGHGGRLGRGRGFYDRMLAQARPDALKVGVCFPRQLVSDTFPEAHDVRMDELVV